MRLSLEIYLRIKYLMRLFLEIPLSNKTFFENSTIFQQVLTQFNVDNNVLIKIKYLTE